ncbi:MAG: HEAT repeat domain-containing protein [Myxococcales bacterium]|nr:HEAT repeat domain-containing protein [Myxococcales bacterium]
MGLFDFLTKSSGDGALKKHAARVANKRAQAADRWESIIALRDMGSAEAVEALTQRFTYATDPSITDQEEKELAFQAIVAAGEGAIEPVKGFLRVHDSLSWGLKMLRGLLDEEAVVGFLLELLEPMDVEYERDPQKKIQVLSALADTLDPRISAGVSRFVEDVNETSRLHAAAALLAQEGAEAHRDILLERLASEESMRVRAQILDGFIARGWDLGDRAAELRSRLPQGYALDAKGLPRK